MSEKVTDWRGWLIVAAIGWALLYVVFVPMVKANPAPQAAEFNSLTTLIATPVIVVLVFVPKRWWKLTTIPIAVVLAYWQVLAWWMARG